MVLAGAIVPAMAQPLGMHVAGQAWNALRLTAPWLSQAGTLAGGVLGGALVGFLQWAPLPRVGARWIAISALAGLAAAVVYLIYNPLIVVAAPSVAALASVAQGRLLPRAGTLFIRMQSAAAAWVALAVLLPFPLWAVGAFIVGAALLSAWGVRSAFVGARA